MGIRYLDKFIHSYPVPLLQDVELQNTNLVIDGSEMVYGLCFGPDNLDLRCGGEYVALRRLIVEFIDSMKQCNIKCYVVFDSFKYKKNIPRYLQTRRDKLETVRRVLENGLQITGATMCPAPLFGKDVLSQTLKEFDVLFVIVPGDGDAELAAIANSLDAPVLAMDTAFCVFDVKKGYLPFADFMWRKVLRGDRPRHSCPAKIFHRNSFESNFRTPPTAVAFIAPLLSNQNQLEGVDFIPFLQSLVKENRIASNLRRGNNRRPDWIECLLLWLNECLSDDQKIQQIKRRVPNFSDERFKEILRLFRDLPDVTVYIAALINGGQGYGTGYTCFEETEGLSVPARYLPIVCDDQSKPSAHRIAGNIRKALSQIGFWKKYHDTDHDFSNLRVLEFDRVGHDYVSAPVNVQINVDDVEALCAHLDRKEVAAEEETSKIWEKRNKFVLKAVLKSDDYAGLDVLGDRHKLLSATLKFWASYENRTAEIRKALAFTLSCSYHNMETPEALLKRHFTFDKNALHSSTQWQICVAEAMRLSVSLGVPLQVPVMGKLFSGQLFQKAHTSYVDNNDLADDDQKENLFGDNRAAVEFFDNIMQLLQ